MDESKMTRDDIIRMAREADREWDCDRDMFEWLEWFANLVAAAERERIYFETSSDFVKSAVAAEREACAKVCDNAAFYEDDPQGYARQCAAAIRARGHE